MLRDVILICLGSGLGGVARFLGSKWINTIFQLQFPLSTFLINILGSYFIGLIIALSARDQQHQSFFLFLTTGFCGGFTTFSTFSNENINLIKNGEYQTALIYILLSIICGLTATFIGYLSVR